MSRAKHYRSRIAVAVVALAASLVNISIASDSNKDFGRCDYDRDRMLALDQKTFDQDSKDGWRTIAARRGCKDSAADLIRMYREKNGSEASILLWHEGQLRAMVCQTESALELLKMTRKADSDEDRFGWNHYVDATVAFLIGDKAALLAARQRLIATPEPENFNPVDSFGKPIKVIWPPNLNVVDGLISCFGKSYNVAYNECSAPFLDDET